MYEAETISCVSSRCNGVNYYMDLPREFTRIFVDLIINHVNKGDGGSERSVS